MTLIVRALGAVSKNQEKRLHQLDIQETIESIYTTELLKLARIISPEDLRLSTTKVCEKVTSSSSSSSRNDNDNNILSISAAIKTCEYR